MNSKLIIKIGASLIFCFLIKSSFSQAAFPNDAFIGKWISKDSAIEVTKHRMARLYINSDSTWETTRWDWEHISFIDTTITSGERIYESWGLNISTLVAETTDGRILVDYTGIFCIYRLQLVTLDSLKLSVSKPYKIRQGKKEILPIVDSKIKEAYKGNIDYQTTISFTRLKNNYR